MAGRQGTNGTAAAGLAVATVVTPSTTWVTKRVRITGSPKGQRAQSPQAAALRSLGRRNPRDPLTISVKYRGGSETWIEIHARGIIYRCPGERAIYDILRDLCRDW